MAHGYTHLRQSPVTIGATALNNCGVRLFCRCGHMVSLPPAALAALAKPAARLWDLKRRSTCKVCGSPGSSDDVTLNIFVNHEGSGPGPRLTPPQLWPA